MSQKSKDLTDVLPYQLEGHYRLIDCAFPSSAIRTPSVEVDTEQTIDWIHLKLFSER